MNKIYKTIWNTARGCLVVVNEATKSSSKDSVSSGSVSIDIGTVKSVPSLLKPLCLATLLCFAVNTYAQDVVLEGGTEVLQGVFTDSITGYGSVTVDSVNSPDGKIILSTVKKQDAQPNPDTGKFDLESWHKTRFESKGDVTVSQMAIRGEALINGNVTITENYTPEEKAQAINEIRASIKNATNWPSKYEKGYLELSGAAHAPTTINGDVNTFVFKTGATFDLTTETPPNEYFGYNVVNGNVNTAFLTIDNHRGFDKYADLLKVTGTIHATEDVVNNGALEANKLIVDGTFFNGNGTYLNDEGLPDQAETPESYIHADIKELNANKIINGSNLYVGKLTNTREQIYEQHYGTIQVDENWFTNSTINLSGGIIDEEFLGTAHNLGLNNVYNVTGGKLKVSDLRGDSTINLSEKGKLETFVSSIFENYDGIANPDGLNTISMSAVAPDAVKNTVTKIFKKYAPGTVIENVMDRVHLNGGQIIITGMDIAANQRDDLIKAFKAAFGSTTEIIFEGNVLPNIVDDILNMKEVNELADANVLKDVIYVDRGLEGENQAVVIGNVGVKNSTGFQSIKDATSVTVQDGKTLALIGSKVEGFKLADTGVTVNGNSALNLGAKGLQNAQDYRGSLTSVTADDASEVNFVTGQYKVAQVDLSAGSSMNVEGVANVDQVTATAKSDVTVKKGGTYNGTHLSLEAGSSLTNAGTTTLNDGITGSGQSNLVNSANASLNVKGNSTLNGTFTNAGHAVLANLDLTGSLINQNTGNLEVNALSVSDKLENHGQFTAKGTSTVNAQLINDGTMNLVDTTIGNHGQVTNTKKLFATGTFSLNGSLESTGEATFETLALSGTTAFVQNTEGGRIEVDTLTLANGAIISNVAGKNKASVLVARDLNVAQGTTITNSSESYYGQGRIDGTLENVAGGQTTLGASKEVLDGQGVAIGKTGQLKNAGTVIFGGALDNEGAITGNGKVVFKHEGVAKNIFNNAGTIEAGTLEADSVTYNHNNGTLTAKNGGFTNSSVNVKGGAMALAGLGSGNTFTIGNKTPTNAKTATLTANNVTSDSEVNIVDGGTLVANEINLTQDKKTIHLSGGTLSTTLNQIFANVENSALDIEAQNPNDKVDIIGAQLATGVSDVKDSIQKGIEFGWGTVAFDDTVYSASIVTDVLNKLDAVDVDPQGHEGQLEVAFSGTAAQQFDVDLANKIVANKKGSGDSTYATYVSEVMKNESTGNPTNYTKLFVGNKNSNSALAQKDANVLDNSIGFKGIEGATGGVFVGDGHHLVLVGEDGTKGTAANYKLADGAVWVGGSKSMVTLGSYGSRNKTKGRLDTVYVGVAPIDTNGAMGNGTLRIRHGDFRIGTLTNGGQIYIGGDGKNGLRKDSDVTLTVTKFVANGNPGVLTNFGTFKADTIEMGKGTGQAKIINENVMKADEVTFNGTLTNKKTFTGKNVTLVYGASHDTHELTSKESVNAKDATWTSGNMTIAGNSKWGSGADARGGFTNHGKLNVNQALTVDGTMANHGTVNAGTLAVSGELSNTQIAQTTVDVLNVTGGKLENAGTLTAGQATLQSNVDNTGTLTADVFKVAGAGSLKNKATLNAKQATIESELVNDGLYATDGTTINTNGLFTNNGTIEATGKVSVAGGKLINNKTANLNGLDITAGQVVISEGSTFKNKGKTSVNMANKTDVAIDNKIDLELSELNLVKGTISGGTLHATNAKVGAEGVLDQMKGFFESLVNSGTVNLVSGKVNGLDNQATGQLTSAGDLTLAGNSAGTVTANGALNIDTNKIFTSTGTLTANADTHVNGTLNVGGTTNLNGNTSIAQGGELNAQGTTTLKGNTTIASTGALSANGTFNASNINLAKDAKFSSSGQSEVGKVVAQAGSNLNVDGGLLHVGDLSASNMIYTQTAGSISSDKGWFVDSVLNIAGGKLDASQIKDANGKVTGDLGHNTINVSGKNPMPSINNEDTPENKSHWKDDLTVVTANKVTSDTTINLNAGGVLDVEEIELTGPTSITLNGGGLQTSLREIFDSVTTEAIKIDAEDAQSGGVQLDTTVLATTHVGEVQLSIKDGIQFNSGAVAFDDENFSASTIVSAGIQFGKVIEESKNVTMHFLGKMAEKFSIDTADKLIEEGLPEVLHGIVLDTTTLHNTSKATGDVNKTLVIGGTAAGANSIGINMGFQNVANADNVTIEGGKEFALVGYQRPEGFDWTTGYDDSNKLLVDAANGGSVTVNNGIFTMGSDGLNNPTVGWVNGTNIGANGTLVVKNGEFANWEITNAGTINVNKNGTLHTNGLTNTNALNVAGALTVESLNNANGTITNVGSILVSATDDINGTINNGGKFEAQGQVTVSGNYTSDKNGKNIFEDLTVSGVMANAGDLLIKGEEGVTDDEFKLTIAQGGKLTNAGTLTNTSHDTKVEGTLINGGTVNYDDMAIVAGGVSNNSGTEKGAILTIAKDGQYTNTGIASWTQAHVGGDMSLGEKAQTTIANVLELLTGSTLTNKGTLDASKAEMTVAGMFNNQATVKGDELNVEAGGKLDNTGNASWSKVTVAGELVTQKAAESTLGDMTIAKGGSVINHGIENGNALIVGGHWENNAQSSWDSIKIVEGGDTLFDRDAQTTTKTLTVAGGLFNVNAGDFAIDKLELTNGQFVVGNKDEVSEDNKIDFVVKDVDLVNTHTWVGSNANLTLGASKDFNKLIGMPDLPKNPSRVTVGKTVTIGEQGSLAVGTDSWTDQSQHVTVTDGSLYFGKDSTTIIDSASLGHKAPAFQGSLEGATVTVEEGATLVLGNITSTGDYTITQGFGTSGNMVDNGWNGGWDKDNLIALPQIGSGLKWQLTLNNSVDKVWVTAKLEDVLNKFPNLAIPNNTNDNLNNPTSLVDNVFINNVITDKHHSLTQRAEAINSVAEIGLSGSVMGLAMNDLSSSTNSIENRVSMMSEVFNSDGTMTRDYSKGHGLWIDALHSQQQADSYQAKGEMSVGHDASSTGFVIGYDYLLDNDCWIFGGALSYQKGNSDSTGNVIDTKNSYTTLGAHAYLAYSPSSMLNVVGSVGYLRNSAEVEQALPFGGFDKAEAEVETNMFTAGVRAESTLKLTDTMKVVPHVGVRIVHADSGSYDTELDGKKAFENESDATTLVQFPVGVAVRMDKQLSNGWMVRPQADITFVGQAGDKEQTIRVKGNAGVEDSVFGDYTGSYNTQMTFGMQAEHGKSTFGARYGLNVGGDGKQDHTFKVEARFNF